MKIKVDDRVIVLCGDDKGVEGRVLSVNHQKGKVVVEGVNKVYKHVRRSQKNPQGGRLSREMPIPISNVKVYCPSCSSPTRVGLRVQEDGSKDRYCKSCGQTISTISPPRASRAQ